MEEVILHKFQQHADLRRELLQTGEAELIEVTSPCSAATEIHVFTSFPVTLECWGS